MTYTLFDITLRAAQELSVAIDSLATDGAVGTLTDINELLGNYSDDHFNRGTVWIVSDTAGAAPQGEFTRLTDFVSATGVATFRDNLTAAVGAGDVYSIANREYRLDTLINQVNKVLRGLMVMTEDITTITTAAEQTEYDLPAAILDDDIDVYIQGKTGDTNDYKWQRIHGWYIRETGTGTAKKLVFKTQPPQPYLLRLVYWTPHEQLFAAADELRESVDLNRVGLETALECLKWKKAQPGTHKKDLDQRIQDMTRRTEQARWASPLSRTHVRLATWGSHSQYTQPEDS